RTLEWDADDRLVAITTGTHRTEFTYDGRDRRARMVDKDNGVIVRDAHLIWDGPDLVEERLSTGTINRFFERGELDGTVARYSSYDHLASVREVLDSTGALLTRNDFDPYGRLTRVGGTEDSRFGFTRHYVHPASGLALPQYRAYDAELGRWVSSDPLGF